MPDAGRIVRCPWGETADEAMRAYHDTEWGRPCHDETRLFEMLSLELMQAGLSWSCVLHKRDAFRRAFAGFDVRAVAAMGPQVDALLQDAGIIRNRRKIEAIINNAQVVCGLYENGTTLDAYLWALVGGSPIDGGIATQNEMPPYTPLAERASKQMRRDGFRFCGPTVVYSLMQATGMVNDHLTSCFVHQELTHAHA